MYYDRVTGVFEGYRVVDMGIDTVVRVVPDIHITEVNLIEDKNVLYDRYVFGIKKKRYLGCIIFYHEFVKYTVHIDRENRRTVSSVIGNLLLQEDYRFYEPYGTGDKEAIEEIQEYTNGGRGGSRKRD